MLKFYKMFVLFFSLSALACCTLSNEETYEEVENNEVICTWSENEWISRGGLKICPNMRVCSDEELVPYQPCVIPMP